MKRILSFCLILISSLSLLAQTESRIQRPKKEKPYVYPSSVIKINTTSLLFKTFAIQYERKLSSHWSLGLGVLYRPSSSLLYFKSMSENSSVSLTPNARYAYGGMKMSRFAITPDFKYYLRKTAPRGLYLAPFVRYLRDAQNFDYKYYETNISASNVKYGTATMIDRKMGLGVLFGYQLLNKKKLAVDFWFLGPWFGNIKSSISSKINMGNLNQIDKNAISSDLEEISGIAIKNDNAGFNGNSTGYTFGLRMIGVNIGYNF